ncbi:MAG: hypothetical protein ACLFTF_06185 [Desulfonatronovibrio sp.]
MNTFRVLFLTLVFALSMLFLIQNTQALDASVTLDLDLWWAELSSPLMDMYVVVFLCLLLGAVFGVIAFFPGNRELRRKHKLQKARLKNLTQEVLDMQKTEDVQENKQEETTQAAQTAEETRRPGGKILEEDLEVKPSGTSGKIALVGIFVMFILLTGFYFFMDQKMTQFQNQMDSTIAESAEAVELARKVDRETAGYREDIENLARTQNQHQEEIAALQSLPQDTMDYLTMMLINEYSVKIDQLMKSAGTEEDRELLEDIKKSLGRALGHYQEKID